MQATRHHPRVVGVCTYVSRSSVVGEEGEDDTQVDGSSEDAGAEASNGRWSNLGDVYRSGESTSRERLARIVAWECATQDRKEANAPNNRRLADTYAGDESAGIDGTETAARSTAHEDGDTSRPSRAKDAGSPKTTDAVTYREGASCWLA